VGSDPGLVAARAIGQATLLLVSGDLTGARAVMNRTSARTNLCIRTGSWPRRGPGGHYARAPRTWPRRRTMVRNRFANGWFTGTFTSA